MSRTVMDLVDAADRLEQSRAAAIAMVALIGDAVLDPPDSVDTTVEEDVNALFGAFARIAAKLHTATVTDPAR